MIRALAPGMPRGCSWAWLSIVLIAAMASAAAAQTTGPAGSSKKADAPDSSKKKAAGEEKDAGEAKKADAEEAPAEPEAKKPLVEIFEDPNAAKANENNFTPLPLVAYNPTRQNREVRAMAAGESQPDTELIQKYVKYYAAQMTSKSAINALINANAGIAPNAAASRAIREASAALTEPIEQAKKVDNKAFLTVYTRALLADSSKLLSNHLIPRIETMIALAKTGHPEALDTFVKQLNDKDQTVWVKLWAARGITNILQTPAGYQELQGGPVASSKAAKALISFLGEDNLPWPAQMRALEALGALRLASDPVAQSKLEMASAALERLSDPKARLEVRAEAGWALGMMRVSTAAGKVNFPLIAYYLGEVAADLGERVAESYATNMVQARYWTSPLLYQVWPALNGVTGVRESGLLHMPSLAAGDRDFINQVTGLVKPVAKSAVELIKSPGGGREKLAKQLSDRVGALKAFLDKNAPSDKRLVPGGKPFPLQAQMAGNVGNQARAGAADDR